MTRKLIKLFTLMFFTNLQKNYTLKLVLISSMIERERQQTNDNDYRNLMHSKYLLFRSIFIKKNISKFKSNLLSLIKNIKGNPSQKIILLFIAHKILNGEIHIRH